MTAPTNTVSQAFPTVAYVSGGLTARDYFAAHAPTDIPKWFSPIVTSPAPKDVSAREKFYEDQHRRRYFAWRWHYADMMVRARESS